MDLWGKYNVNSIYGNSYYLLMIDDASCYITVEFLKAKSQAAQKIKDYIMYLIARNKVPLAICIDRGTEFMNKDLQSWGYSHEIIFQLIASYSPLQNSVAKQMNCTLVKLVCAMLTASKLPKYLWEPAVAHATYV